MTDHRGRQVSLDAMGLKESAEGTVLQVFPAFKDHLDSLVYQE